MPGSHGAAEPAQGLVRRWTPTYDISLRAVLGVLGRGPRLATCRDVDGVIWRTSRTPQGPVAQRLERLRDGDVESRTWGPGASWVAETLPALLGAADDGELPDPGLFARSPFAAVREAPRRWGSRWRVPSTGVVLETLVLAVLEQRVTGMESQRAWQQLLRDHGEAAPGPRAGDGVRPGQAVPPGMRVPPDATTWAMVPSWEWHAAGVEQARSRTVVAAARAAGRLEECVGMPHEAARSRLRAVPGVGVWTAAEVAVRALGDPDAVSFGDAHLAANVVHALTGAEDGDDDAMAALLAPSAGARYRAVRLVELTMPGRPRRGPRYSPLDHRRR